MNGVVKKVRIPVAVLMENPADDIILIVVSILVWIFARCKTVKLGTWYYNNWRVCSMHSV